jgi:glycine cleavage system H protein
MTGGGLSARRAEAGPAAAQAGEGLAVAGERFPEDLGYTREHEWYRAADGRVGITHHAQQALGDIVYVELPAPGTRLEAGRPLGTVESVKSVSDLYAPVSGVVQEVNAELQASPELVNRDPYGRGWMLRVAAEGPPAGLLSAAEYRSLVEEG